MAIMIRAVGRIPAVRFACETDDCQRNPLSDDALFASAKGLFALERRARNKNRIGIPKESEI
jgi:hypothetical protein